VENRLSELWSIMEFTNPGLLGPAEKFRERYAIPIERHGSPEATQALKRITQGPRRPLWTCRPHRSRNAWTASGRPG